MSNASVWCAGWGEGGLERRWDAGREGCGWAIRWSWSPVTLRSWRLPGADVAACSLPLKSQPVFFFSYFFFFSGGVCLVCEHLWETQTTRGLAPVRQLSELHISPILTMSPLTTRRAVWGDFCLGLWICIFTIWFSCIDLLKIFYPV